MTLTLLATLMFAVQLIHSLEELATGFHARWYLFRMRYPVFLTFEIIFTTFWAFAIFTDYLPYKSQLLTIWVILMTANGAQHVIWALVTKKYVPGLLTSPFHLLLAATYFFW